MGMAETFDRLAALAAACAQPERALRLAGAGDALYAELGTVALQRSNRSSSVGSHRCAQRSENRPPTTSWPRVEPWSSMTRSPWRAA